jgi:hypothetical protein
MSLDNKPINPPEEDDERCDHCGAIPPGSFCPDGCEPWPAEMTVGQLRKALEGFDSKDGVSVAIFFSDGTAAMCGVQSVSENAGPQLNVEHDQPHGQTAFPADPLQEIVEMIDQLHSTYPTGDWRPSEVSKLLVLARRRAQAALGIEPTPLSNTLSEDG